MNTSVSMFSQELIEVRVSLEINTLPPISVKREQVVQRAAASQQAQNDTEMICSFS